MIELIFRNSLRSLQRIIPSISQQFWIWQVACLIIDWIDLPQLTTLTTGDESFFKTDSLVVKSMMIDDCLNWSSSTYLFHYRRWFILASNKFESNKYHNWWLIELIFLSSLTLLLEKTHSIFQNVWIWRVWWVFIGWLDLTRLSTMSLGHNSFDITRFITLTSTSFIPSSSDVPFINGTYSQSGETFHLMNSTRLTSDITSLRLKECILNEGCSEFDFWFVSSLFNHVTMLINRLCIS